MRICLNKKIKQPQKKNSYLWESNFALNTTIIIKINKNYRSFYNKYMNALRNRNMFIYTNIF